MTEFDQLNCLFRELDGVYHETAVRAGLSDSAFYILRAIVEIGDGCQQRDIVEHYHLSKQTVNSSVQNLKAKGYIFLAPGRGRDRHIHLMPAGQQIAEEKIYPVIGMEHATFGGLLPEERRELLRLTQKYVRMLRERIEQSW